MGLMILLPWRAYLRRVVPWVLPLLLMACVRPPVVQQESFVFGTQVQVTVAGVPEVDAHGAISAVLAEFDRLHHLLHAWQPSEITRLNESIAAGKSHEVPEEIAALLREAQALAATSGGLFDPGIGRLIALWGFQNDEFQSNLPPASALDEWRQQRPSIGDLTIAGTTVTSRQRAVAVDLGGYAKGVALDRAVAIMRERGVKNALINIGGNVMALGSKNGTPWRVGVKDPREAGHLATLELRDGEAIGTSGDYQRYFMLDGKRYSHLIDPRTGTPAEGTQAVTILVTPERSAEGGDVSSAVGVGTRSDALSKPLFIAGAQGWRDMARRIGITHAMRVDATGKIEVTEAFAARLDFGRNESGRQRQIERFR